MTNQDILEALSGIECALYYRKDGSDDLEGVSAQDTEQAWKIVNEALRHWHQVTGCTLK